MCRDITASDDAGDQRRCSSQIVDRDDNNRENLF